MSKSLIISSSLDKRIKIWNWKTHECLKTVKLTSPINQLIKITNSQFISACDLSIHIWNSITYEYLKTIKLDIFKDHIIKFNNDI